MPAHARTRLSRPLGRTCALVCVCVCVCVCVVCLDVTFVRLCYKYYIYIYIHNLAFLGSSACACEPPLLSAYLHVRSSCIFAYLSFVFAHTHTHTHTKTHTQTYRGRRFLAGCQPCTGRRGRVTQSESLNLSHWIRVTQSESLNPSRRVRVCVHRLTGAPAPPPPSLCLRP